MKLLVLVLGLSCVVAYTSASKGHKKKGHNWSIKISRNKITFTRRFRREADPEGPIAANLKDTPQLFYDHNENLRLVPFHDEHMIDDIGEDDNVVSGTEPMQSNAQLHNMHPLDENDHLSAYSFHPDAYDGFAENFGTGGGFRWKREARRRVQPRFRFEAEKNLGRNSFVTGFVDLQQGRNGRRLEPTVGATAGLRFRREADQIEEIEDEIPELY